MARIAIPLPEGPFAGLDVTTLAVFGLIEARLRASMRRAEEGSTAFVQDTEDGPASVYCVYPQEEIAARLGVSIRTVRSSIRTLEEARLIVTTRAGRSAPNRYRVRLMAMDYLDGRQTAKRCWDWFS